MFSLRPRFALLLAVGMLAGTATTAHALDADLTLCATQNFPFVFVGTRVTDGGLPVLALPESNFSCTENGVLQTELFGVTPPEEGGGVRLAGTWGPRRSSSRKAKNPSPAHMRRGSAILAGPARCTSKI